MKTRKTKTSRHFKHFVTRDSPIDEGTSPCEADHGTESSPEPRQGR